MLTWGLLFLSNFVVALRSQQEGLTLHETLVNIAQPINECFCSHFDDVIVLILRQLSIFERHR